MTTIPGAFDDAVLIGSFLLDRVEVLDDLTKRIVLRDRMSDLDVPVQRNVFPPGTPGVGFQTVPLVIGGCRSIPVPPIDQDGVTGWLSELGVAAVGTVRDRGDALVPTTDYTLDAGRDRLTFVEEPIGPVTCDVSTVGSADEFGADLFGGDGDPFTGLGGPPDGWAVGASSGDDPFVEEISYPQGPGGAGKPNHAQGVQFTEGAAGGYSWIALGTIAAGYVGRYAFSVRLPTSEQIRFGLAYADDPDTFQVSWVRTGYYAGTLINRTGASQDIYLVCTRDGSNQAAFLTYATLIELTPAEPAIDLLGESLELTMVQLADKARVESINLADPYAIDLATGYQGVGLYIDKAETTLADALAAVLPSYCAAIWQDDEAEIRTTRLIDPSSVDVEDRAGTIYRYSLDSDLRVMPDLAPGLTKRAGYQRNWFRYEPSDYVTDFAEVSAADRLALSADYRDTVACGLTVASRYRHADRAPPVGFLFTQVADARTELARVVGLYTIARDFYSAELPPGHATRYVLGEIWTLVYPRYGLDEGKAVMVVGIDEDLDTRAATLLLWG